MYVKLEFTVTAEYFFRNIKYLDTPNREKNVIFIFQLIGSHQETYIPDGDCKLVEISISKCFLYF